jgi:riboflavin synthase
MFTGLIEATGTVSYIGNARITIAAPSIARRIATGDSVAVSGVCLTALDIDESGFSADLADETLARTTLGLLKTGSVVNLELPTPAGAPLGGHVVQGHVDGTGTMLALEPLHPDWRLRLRLPEGVAKYVVPQGSIAVEGISLTVASIVGDVVEIAIIPHTYAVTSLHSLAIGDALNIEVDVLGKYAERRLAVPQGFEVTVEYLLANGY